MRPHYNQMYLILLHVFLWNLLNSQDSPTTTSTTNSSILNSPNSSSSSSQQLVPSSIFSSSGSTEDVANLTNPPPFYSNIVAQQKSQDQEKLVAQIKQSLSGEFAKLQQPISKVSNSSTQPAQTPSATPVVSDETVTQEAPSTDQGVPTTKKIPTDAQAKKKKEKEAPPSVGLDVLDTLADIFSDDALKRTISLHIQPTPVQEVIAMIGRIAHLDFVIDPDVTGTTGRIRCDTCTVSQLLQFICTTNHPRLALIRYFNAWQIMRFEKAVKLIEIEQQQSFTLRTIGIYNAKFDADFQHKVQEVWNKITANIGDQEKKRSYIMFDSLNRKIFVYAFHRHVTDIHQFIREIDRAIPQVRIDVVLVTASKSYTYNFGFNWSGVYNRQATLTARNPRLGLAGIGASVTEFPTPDVGNSQSSGQPLSNTNLLIDPLNFALNLVSAPSSITIPFVFGGPDLNLRRLNLILNAAESESKLKILSRPSVLTNNGETAEMLVGESIPLVTKIEDAVEGKIRNTTDTRFKDIGTHIKVRPDVNLEKKTILLDIWVQDNEVAGQLGRQISSSGTLPSSSPPVISTLLTTNKVLLHSGQTTVIGGLVRNSVQKKKTLTPFLHRIPIVGWFFRATENEQLDQEQLIFITPTLIEQNF